MSSMVTYKKHLTFAEENKKAKIKSLNYSLANVVGLPYGIQWRL